MGRVEGKVCIVTGAATGLGKADAMVLAREGAWVVATDIDDVQGKATASEIGERVSFVHHDVRSEEQWVALIADTMKRMGRLDVLVNNAGVIDLADVESASLENWRFVNAVNVEGTFLGCKHAIPAMRSSGGGSIINLSSSCAIQGQPSTAAYTASKGAIPALTRMVAVHCLQRGDRIRCNVVFPHMVESSMARKGLEAFVGHLLPSERPTMELSSPLGVANTVLFLASDESSDLNGASLNLDRGTACVPGELPMTNVD